VRELQEQFYFFRTPPKEGTFRRSPLGACPPSRSLRKGEEFQESPTTERNQPTTRMFSLVMDMKGRLSGEAGASPQIATFQGEELFS